MLLPFCFALVQGACPSIAPGFADPSITDTVHALSTEGVAGPLTVGGQFNHIGQFTYRRVRQWNGESWDPLDGGLSGTVFALAHGDLGAGPRTFAGGEHSDSVSAWDGAHWTVVPGGPQGRVTALLAFDDGAGTQLYAGGEFAATGGAPIARLARFDGAVWSAVGATFDAPVRALAVHDDGTGPALYAGGEFLDVGGVPAARIARWDGSAWSALGEGTNGVVRALRSFGGELYAGGAFTSAGTNAAAHVARWNGSAWLPLATGVDATVHALTVHDDGSGSRLFAGGDFALAGGLAANGIAAWDGGAWSSTAAGVSGSVRCLASWDAGTGAELVAGGSFRLHAGASLLNVARWDGVAWRALSEGLRSVAEYPAVSAVARYDGGSGPAVYVGGQFTDGGGIAIGNLGRWNGTSWESIGGVYAAGGHVSELVPCDLGAGPELLVAGTIESAGGVSCANVARWNGAAFAPLGDGLSRAPRELIVDGQGAGAVVYAGSQFFTFAASPSSCVARWSGGAWESAGVLTGTVNALAFYDDGDGSKLYAGGRVTISGADVYGVARWTGAIWLPVGAPIGATGSGVLDLLAATDEDGAALYAAGQFATLGGTSGANLARWNGGTWSSMGSGLEHVPFALTLFDDGSGHGRRLHLGAGLGVYARDGGVWSASVAVAGSAWTLAALESPFGHGRELWCAGPYSGLGAGDAFVESRGLGTLRACDETGLTYCFGDGSEIACPCGNASAVGARQGCAHSLGNGGALRASGRASLSQDTLVLDGSTMTNSSALYFQGLVRSAPVPFGDGIKCTSGPFVRLATKNNVAGASRYPDAGDASVSARGHVLAPGTRHYQVRYRNAAVFCTSETFNYTNAVAIEWGA